ncbi:hypothetical protein Taro_016612 [Colocasia esculenta]|uniref:Uncharacterized protein n=1 Tax=Colocasia esculenta TaxID=4460 RepID=A0A843UQU1_COLES|nr:hypothetical protein [Colocasia esculenta]
MILVPVGLPGSSRPLMVENVAWDGYNRSVSQGACSEPFKHTFRAGTDDPLGGIPPRGLTASDQAGGILEIITSSWDERDPLRWGHTPTVVATQEPFDTHRAERNNQITRTTHVVWHFT